MRHFFLLFMLVAGISKTGFAAITGISISSQSACNGKSTTCLTDDFFTADITVVFDEIPATGTLSLSGDDLVGTAPSVDVAALPGNSYTFSGVNLRADGLAIELTAAFSAGGNFTGSSLGTAPAGCSTVPSQIYLGSAFYAGTLFLAGPINGTPHWSNATGAALFWTGANWQVNFFGSIAGVGAGSFNNIACNWNYAGGWGAPQPITLSYCGPLPLPAISAISVTGAADCDTKNTCTPTDDTFVADATVQFAFAPSTGDLLLKRGGAILAVKAASELQCASEWTFEDVEMPANGQPIVLTAEFENGPSFTSQSLGNAAFCSTGDITNFTAANISACNGASTTCETDDYFTADLTVTFQSIPATGQLVVTGGNLLGAPPTVNVADFSGNSYTFTAVQMRADGGSIDLIASFTDGCHFENTSLGVASVACSTIPNTITVGGFAVCPAETGPYQLNGIYNGAPQWSGPTDDLRWDGTSWVIFYRPQGWTLSYSSSGNASTIPCTGWTNGIGCGIPTFDFCGQFSASAVNVVHQIGLINPTGCQGNTVCADDFFTAGVNVVFSYAPATGNLVLKRGTTVLATKPASELTCLTSWTFENVQIVADGEPLVLTAQFENGASLSASLGNAPAICSDKKIKTISLANFSGCSHNNTTCATDDFFTADVTLTFTTVPTIGTLSLSGDDLLGTPPTVNVADVSGNSHTFIAVKFRADGLAVGLTASFSDGCSTTKNNLATAPTGCSNPPPVIVATGYCFGTLNGDYNLAGMENGAPYWVSAFFGYAQRVVWNGTDWVVMSNYTPLSIHSGGNAGFFPCGAFTNLNSCGAPTFNFCGEIVPNLSVNNLLGISIADVSGCQHNSTGEPADDFFTADVNVQFRFAQPTGNLILKRGTTVLASKLASELACANNWTFENVAMVPDGQPIFLIAEFENGYSLTSGNLGTAPVSCSLRAHLSGTQLICDNEAAHFAVEIVGGVPPYQVQILRSLSGMLTISNYMSGDVIEVIPTVSETYTLAGVQGAGPAYSALTGMQLLTVLPGSHGGAVSNSQTICHGVVPTTLNLTGQQGQVLKWQSSPDGLNWTDISTTTTYYSSPALTATRHFRAIVKHNDCTEAVSATAIISVNQPVEGGTITPGQTICSGATPFPLSLQNQVGTVEKWQFSTNGTTWTDITFTGTAYQPGLLTASTQFRAVVKSGDCGMANSLPVSILVNPQPVPTIGSLLPVCVNAEPVSLSGSPAGGTWSGIGVNGTTFSPSAAGVGLKTITYSATASGCTGSTSAVIQVNGLPSVSLNDLAAVCLNSPVFALAGGLPTGGIFSGPGVEAGNFDPVAAGVGSTTINYSFTNGNGCMASASKNITVNGLPEVSLAPQPTVCATASPFALSGGFPTGGSYSGPGVSGGIFTATAAGAGVHVINYSVTNVNGCTNPATENLTASGSCSTSCTILTCPAPRNVNMTAACKIVIPNLLGEVVLGGDCNSPSVKTQSPAAGSLVSATHNLPQNVVISVVDVAGITTNCTVVLTPKDVSGPTITNCSANPSTAVLNSACKISVPNFAAMTTATDCTGPVTKTQLPAAGTAVTAVHNQSFSLVITVTDAAGNSTVCTRTVVAKDQTKPTISTCAPAETVPLGTGCVLVFPNKTGQLVATDACSNPLVKMQSPAANSTVTTTPGATHTMTLTVTDAAGNSKTCTAVITAGNCPPPPPLLGHFDGTTEAEKTEKTIENNPVTAAQSIGFQTMPNPFSDELTIDFDLPESGKTRLVLMDMTGQFQFLSTEKGLEKGRQKVVFNTGDLPGGTYFVGLKTESAGWIWRKVVLVR